MQCGICKKEFIFTKTKDEFKKQRELLDEKLLQLFIDKKIEFNEKECWNESLKAEAMLLFPSQQPQKCIIDNCNARICTFCYNYMSNTCHLCVDQYLKQIIHGVK